MRKERKHYTAEEKVAVLRRHLLDKVPVSDLCEELGLQPTVFYRWQKEFFENGAAAFQTTEQNFKPLVIRINDIGRAEAVKYDTIGYKPQDAEIKYFLSDFCRLYYSRNRYTMRDNFKKSLLFMEAQLANSVAEAYRKNHTVEGYLQDSSAPDIDIDV